MLSSASLLSPLEALEALSIGKSSGKGASSASNDEQASQDSQARTLVTAMERLRLPRGDTVNSLELHILGADEKELPTMDISSFSTKWSALFRRVAPGCAALHFLFLGPNMPSARNARKVSFEWKEQALALQVTLEMDCRLYHDYLADSGRVPQLAVAFNAGLWGYDAWLPSIEALFRGWHHCTEGYLVITSYTLQESEDDYDTMQSCYDGLAASGLAGRLRWEWDCEANPHKCSLKVERQSLAQAGGCEDRTYRENHYWQCVSLNSPSPASSRTRQRCHCSFNLGDNTESSCLYHSESYGGETAQQWLAPGDTAGAGAA